MPEGRSNTTIKNKPAPPIPPPNHHFLISLDTCGFFLLCNVLTVHIRKPLLQMNVLLSPLTKFQFTVKDGSKKCEQDHFQMKDAHQEYTFHALITTGRVHETKLVQSKIPNPHIVWTSCLQYKSFCSANSLLLSCTTC